MALFSGAGKKYSVNYITCFNEGNAHVIKQYLKDLNCNTFSDSLDKIIEAKAAEASGNKFLLINLKRMIRRQFMMLLLMQ